MNSNERLIKKLLRRLHRVAHHHHYVDISYYFQDEADKIIKEVINGYKAEEE